MGQKCQNLGQLETAIYQTGNKRLTNFQRLESTTIHVHITCVKISNKRRVKKWGKSAKIWGNFKLQYIKLETSY